MKKIIFPIEFEHVTGGMIHSVISLINQLSESYSVYILAYKDAEIMKLNLKAHLLPLNNPWTVSLQKPIETIRTYLDVKKILQNIGADDIIFTNNVGSELLLSGFGFFPIKGKRIFVSRGGTYSGKTGYLLRKGFQSVAHFVATSTHQKKILEDCGIESNKIDIIANGINIDNSYMKAIKTIKYISIVGYISKYKNQRLALMTLAKLMKLGYNDLFLNIYGVAYSKENKEYERLLLDEIKDLNIEKYVIFRGYVTDKYEIYKMTDLLISTSLSEGFGRSLVEAMAFGIPCIGLIESGGVCDIITDKKNGFLINNNPNELSDAIIKLKTNRELLAQMSKDAFNTYNMKYSEVIMTHNYEKLIKELESI